jgi:type IV pilus assembly protein PilV
MRSNRARNSGFSLLEVLIAVVILAIGAIGIASLQLTSSVYNESSLHRSQASGLARELVERMRANQSRAKSGDYDFSVLPSGLTQNCEGSSANCSSVEMVSHDLRVWSSRVAFLLPGGSASVATDSAVSPPQITVTLGWLSRAHRGLLESDDSGEPEPIATSQVFVFEL